MDHRRQVSRSGGGVGCLVSCLAELMADSLERTVPSAAHPPCLSPCPPRSSPTTSVLPSPLPLPLSKQVIANLWRIIDKSGIGRDRVLDIAKQAGPEGGRGARRVERGGGGGG